MLFDRSIVDSLCHRSSSVTGTSVRKIILSINQSTNSRNLYQYKSNEQSRERIYQVVVVQAVLGVQGSALD